jgi:hypothetical protein
MSHAHPDDTMKIQAQLTFAANVLREDLDLDQEGDTVLIKHGVYAKNLSPIHRDVPLP